MLKQSENTFQPIAKTKAIRFQAAGIILNQFINDAEVIIRCHENGLTLKIGKKNTQNTPSIQSFTVLIDKPETLWGIIRNPDPGLGEYYMDGRWSLEEGDIGAFITMLGRNIQALFNGSAGRLFSALIHKPLPQRSHDAEACKSYIQQHYDIGNDLYQSFLDEGMNYSCAFFDYPKMTLREAQLNKINTAIKRLDIQEGDRVLDIGSGWGETTRIIANSTGASQVTGISLAKTQIDLSKEQAKGIKNKPSYILQDYRAHAAENNLAYDRIISIGMFEHVGHDKHEEYFRAIHDQLKPNGKALIHSIISVSGCSGQRMNSPWLEKYIFPGGYIPELPELIKAAEKAGLRLAHEPYIQETFHYAETLRQWRKNFMNNKSKLPTHYDTRFKKMWEFYLALAEAMFDGIGFTVGQVIFEKSKKSNTALVLASVTDL